MTFLRKITRPATAIALGLSVALSPVATTPAKAGNDEALIAGAIGALILGAIAAEALNNGTGRVSVQTGSPHGTGHHDPRRPGTTRPNHHDPRHPGVTRPNHHDQHGTTRPQTSRHQGGNDRPNGMNARTLPQECAVDMRRFGQRGTVYGKRCLNNRYAKAYQLPEQCLTHRLTNATGRHRPAYAARCLEQHGYQLARYGRRH